MIKQIKLRQTQFDLVQKYSLEFNLDYSQVFGLLSEYKSLLAVKGSQKLAKNAKASSILQQYRVEQGLNESSESETADDTDAKLDNNILICGEIKDVASVFAEHPSGDDDELTLAERKKLKGGHIQPRHLVPLNLFLKNTLFDKLINQDVMNRILRAFNVDLNDRPVINQY